ncbi:MAG TPA: cupin domain-containing protein [Ruminiclostridium sp.]
MKKKISFTDVEPTHLEGRDLRWVITDKTVGSEKMSIAIMHCFPLAIVKPLHAHRNIEEVIYIIEGLGQAWIDGELVDFVKGDAVFFPANSKHQVKNMGKEMLITASIFSAVTTADDYILYNESMF